jgi:predicted nucleic acid-binding protein
MFLLDTNVISELRRPERANKNVVTWASTIPAGSFFLSVISIFEIELGTLKIARRDTAQGAILRAWIDEQLLPRFEGRILAVDVAVAQRSAPSCP